MDTPSYLKFITKTANEAQASINAGAEVTPDLLARAYLLLPHSIARRVADRFQRPDMLEDLISIGTLTLFEVARQYDPAKGHFGPYAKRAIENQMSASLIVERGRGSVNQQRPMKKAWELRDEIERRRDSGEPCDPKLVAKELGISVHDIQALTRLTSVRCLDQVMFDDNEATLGDTIHDPDSNPEEQAIAVIAAEERQELHRAVARLSTNVRAALGLSTGFPAFENVTVGDVLYASSVRPQRTAREHIRRQFKEGVANAGRLGFDPKDATGPKTGGRLPSPTPTAKKSTRISANRDYPADIWRRLADRWRQAAEMDTRQSV